MMMNTLLPILGSKGKISKPKTSDLRFYTNVVNEIDFGGLKFVCIHNPEQATLEDFNTKYNFHPLAIDDCLSEFQRSKVDLYDGYLHVILQVPIYDKSQFIITGEISIFVSDKYLVLVHWNNIPKLNKLVHAIFHDFETKTEYMGKGSYYLLYKIFDILVDDSFPIIDKIEKEVRNLENRIFDQSNYEDKKIVRQIAKVRRDIMVFRRIIKPQISLINTIERMKLTQITNKDNIDNINIEEDDATQELELYFGDITDHINKQWDMILDQNELIINLNDTNESLLSVRANSIMKTLTIISVIILPLTLISGVYGMNVRLPIGEHKLAFEIIILAMLLISTVMIAVFRRKKWI